MTRRFVCRAESPLFTAWRNTTYCAELLSGNERLSIDVSLHGTLHHVCSYHWVEEKTRWSMTVIDIFKAQICQICWHKAALEGLKYNIGNYTILFDDKNGLLCFVCAGALFDVEMTKSKQNKEKNVCTLQRAGCGLLARINVCTCK